MERDKRGLFIHNLIQSEFRELLTRKDYKIFTETQAIVVLSSPPNLNDEENIERTEENVKRITLGINIYKQIAAERLGVDVEELTYFNLQNIDLPILILNGDIEQLPMMQKVALEELKFPSKKMRLISAGPRDRSNTKTQFEVMSQSKNFNKLETHDTYNYRLPSSACSSYSIKTFTNSNKV